MGITVVYTYTRSLLTLYCSLCFSLALFVFCQLIFIGTAVVDVCLGKTQSQVDMSLYGVEEACEVASNWTKLFFSNKVKCNTLVSRVAKSWKLFRIFWNLPGILGKFQDIYWKFSTPLQPYLWVCSNCSDGRVVNLNPRLSSALYTTILLFLMYIICILHIACILNVQCTTELDVLDTVSHKAICLFVFK